MCPQHRSDTIARIKDALSSRRAAIGRGDAAPPVRVISTQLVEAGVDLDFPVVFRAMAGLDSIAQAAGRCNREGQLTEGGEVHVFVPPSEPPPGLLRQARDTCKTLWQSTTDDDPLSLPLFERFFRQLYADAQLDRRGICDMLRVDHGAVRFRDAAEAFRLIDNDDGGTVIVNYRRPEATESIDAIVGKIERDGPNRGLLRKLQRYGVTLYQRDIQRLLAGGDIRELGGCPGLYVQASDVFYDDVLGTNAAGAPGDPAALVF
jgi:CRISPR-associated endonuclease/helicase Cas3